MECGVVASRPLFQINSLLHVSVLKHNLEGSVLGAFHCAQVKTDRNFELLIVVESLKRKLGILEEKTLHEFFQRVKICWTIGTVKLIRSRTTHTI